MTGKITGVNKTKDGYEFIFEVEGKIKVFKFPLDFVNTDVNQAINAYLRDLKEELGRLPAVKELFVGKVYEV